MTPPAADPEACTFTKCCAETLKAMQEGEGKSDKKEQESGKGPAGKGCGCAEPELVRALTCGVFGPLGQLL